VCREQVKGAAGGVRVYRASEEPAAEAQSGGNPLADKDCLRNRTLEGVES